MVTLTGLGDPSYVCPRAPRVTIAGAGFTVTFPVPMKLPLSAVTTNGPPALVALNRPPPSIVPPPLAAQPMTGLDFTSAAANMRNGWAAINETMSR